MASGVVIVSACVHECECVGLNWVRPWDEATLTTSAFGGGRSRGERERPNE